MKGGEAVEGWGWARKMQVVGKFALNPSPGVKMVWSNEQRAFAVETYFSQSLYRTVDRAFRTRYQTPPLGTEYPTENPFCCGLRISGEREVSKKEDNGSLEHQNIEAVRRSVL